MAHVGDPVARHCQAVTETEVHGMLGLTDRTRIFDLFDHLMKGEAAPALELLDELYRAGADPAVVIQDLLELTHLLTRAKLVPESLSEVWSTHGFHGTYSHNARGVVNRYLGFYDGNPTNLNPLPLRQEATKYKTTARKLGDEIADTEQERKDAAEIQKMVIARKLRERYPLD